MRSIRAPPYLAVTRPDVYRADEGKRDPDHERV